MALRPQKTVFVGNLNLQTTDNEFEEAFKKFGVIKKAFIVKDNHSGGPKSRGFGYVIFENAGDCKTCFNSKVQLGGRKLKISVAKPKIRADGKKDKENDDDEDDNSNEIQNKAKTRQKFGNKKQQNKNEDMDIQDDDDDDDDEEDEDEMECSNDSDNGEDQTKSDDDEEDGDDIDDEDDDDDDDEMDGDDIDEEDEEANDEDNENGPPQKKMKLDRPLNNNDAEDGRTLFIRNLSFDSVEDDLEEFFEEFGEIQYCRIVVDQKSERSRGIAFVRFRNKEAAEKCLDEYKNNEERFVISGRKLNVTLAVTKDEAKTKFQKQVREDEGSRRNLHLIRLTLIRRGTDAAAGMTEEDHIMRDNILSSAKEKLKNPNIFVSPTRLCVRNIPFEVDDKRLKQAFLKAVGGGKDVKITESRIMRDLSKPRSQGLCWSKGFGFVSFTDHQHALAAVKATNNVPIFGDNKRLIVEFSLENKAVYELRQRRLEKSKNPDKFSKDLKFKGKTQQKFQYPAKVPNPRPGQRILPSHSGAKIRHKPRGNQQVQQKKKQFKKHKPEKKTKEQKKKKTVVKEYTDKVDAMVRKRKLQKL